MLLVIYNFIGQKINSFMNIGYKPIDIDQLKKELLHQALDFNIREQQVKQIKRHNDRERQIQEYQAMSKIANEQLFEQQQKKINKKYYIRNILSQEYDKQMRQKKMLSEIQKRRNRSYADAAQENQRQYFEKRSRELARIYRAQKTYQTINPQFQNIQPRQTKSRLATEISHINTDNKYNQRESIQERFPIVKKNKSLHTQIQSQSMPQTYKDYLKEQIDKKRSKKQEQIRNRLEIQKEFAKFNSRQLQKQQQQLRQIQRRQQQAYKIGLDQQIAQKKAFKNYLG